MLPIIFNFRIQYYEYFILISFFLINLIYSFRINGRYINKKYTNITVLFLISQCIAIFLSQLTDIPNTNIQTSIAYILNIFSFLILICRFELSEKNMHKYFNLHIILALYASIINLYKNYTSIINLNININDPYFVSFSSFFGGRNAFGAFLLNTNIITLYMFMKTKNKKYVLFLIIFLFNLFFTFSRSSIFSFLIFTIIYIVLESRNKILRICSLVGGGILGILVIINSKYFDFIRVFLLRENYGLAGRDDVWIMAKEVILKNPIFGYGIGASENIFSYKGKIASSFHNVYLECLVNGGVLLLIMYIFFLIWILLKYLKIRKFDKTVGSIYVAYWLTYIIYKLFESGMYFAIGDRAVLETIFAISIPLLYLNYLKYNNK